MTDSSTTFTGSLKTDVKLNSSRLYRIWIYCRRYIVNKINRYRLSLLINSLKNEKHVPRNLKCPQHQRGLSEQKQPEEPMVALTYAVLKPRAVVVKLPDTAAAIFTMFGPYGLLK